MTTNCPKCLTENTKDSIFCKKCATPLRSSDELAFTKTIIKPTDELAIDSTFAEKYKIIAEIGRGGMGIVYKAEDLKLRRFVAIKILPSELASDEEAKKRFIQEAQAAAILSHPNICTIYEVEETEGKTYISMEFIDGYSLRERTAKGPLSTEETLDVAIQVAQGLAEAHGKGITHRDIKSANIMLDEKGQAKIMDFGLAKVAGGALITKEARAMGTVAYMSPEQARGEEVDHRTDIWALGVVLYEMMSSQFPFRGDNETSVLYNIEHNDPFPIRKFKNDIPVELEKVINRSLKKKPESRYQSAREILADLQEYQDFLEAPKLGITDFKSFIRTVKRPKIAIPAVLAIILVGLFATLFFNRQSKIRWAREQAIPEINRLIESGWEYLIEAFTLAEEAEKYIPQDMRLIELFSKCSMNISIQTSPPGTKIYMKMYKVPESDWTFLGISPIENVRLAAGYFLWKAEKERYETVEALSSTFSLSFTEGFNPVDIEFTLDEKGTFPPGMVRISGSEELGDFFIDKFEITNRQFKKFMDNGGYQKKEYWKQEFIKDGNVLLWEEAMSEFVDASGRPGPSSWQAGVYPEGNDDYPVSGISWYEAAAYAEYTGKSLPTVSHWDQARGTISSYLTNYFIISLSNFGSDGPSPVGSYQGITSFGVYDMAGNVREWCWNETKQGRCIRGGAWNDNVYMFGNISQISPFDRSTKNGFRCALYLEEGKIGAEVFELYEYQSNIRDYSQEKPVSDDIFKVYKDRFSYDPKELNTRMEERDENAIDWIKEKISFDTAYRDERMMAYLFLPKNASPPYQAVIYFPGSSALYQSTSDQLEIGTDFQYYLSYIIRNRRAVVYPVYKDTFERRPNTRLRRTPESHQYAEYMIQLTQDFSRVIDYLETRSDIASDKLAFYGMSWGGGMGLIIPAVENRLQTNIITVGGLPKTKRRTEVDEINFISRITIPTLMLNGIYDTIFPYETTVKPAYDLLGTSEENKKLIMYESDHFIPRTELIKEVLNWLDKYLGPAK